MKTSVEDGREPRRVAAEKVAQIGLHWHLFSTRSSEGESREAGHYQPAWPTMLRGEVVMVIAGASVALGAMRREATSGTNRGTNNASSRA